MGLVLQKMAFPRTFPTDFLSDTNIGPEWVETGKWEGGRALWLPFISVWSRVGLSSLFQNFQLHLPI